LSGQYYVAFEFWTSTSYSVSAYLKMLVYSS
jgi:hypothetical protein